MKLQTLLIGIVMGLMVNLGGELVRYNPANGKIEFSNNQGRSWYSRYTSSSIGSVKSLIECGSDLVLCSDKGVFFSNNQGRSWYTRNSTYKNFIDLSNTGSELLATTADGHLYFSNNQGRSWYKRR